MKLTLKTLKGQQLPIEAEGTLSVRVVLEGLTVIGQGLQAKDRAATPDGSQHDEAHFQE